MRIERMDTAIEPARVPIEPVQAAIERVPTFIEPVWRVIERIGRDIEHAPKKGAVPNRERLLFQLNMLLRTKRYASLPHRSKYKYLSLPAD